MLYIVVLLLLILVLSNDSTRAILSIFTISAITIIIIAAILLVLFLGRGWFFKSIKPITSGISFFVNNNPFFASTIALIILCAIAYDIYKHRLQKIKSTKAKENHND